VWLGHLADEDYGVLKPNPFHPTRNQSLRRQVCLLQTRKNVRFAAGFFLRSYKKILLDWPLSGLLSVKPVVSSSATVRWSNKRWFITNVGRAFRYKSSYLWPTAKPQFTRGLRKGSKNRKKIEAYYIDQPCLWLSIVRILYYSTKAMFIIQ